MMRTLQAVFFGGALAAVLAAAPVPSISLIPANGVVGAPAGSAAGFGFTLSDASSDWVVLTGSSFTGTPVYGTYLDYLSLPTAPLYVAGPAPESATVSQSWDLSAQLGLGEFDIDSTTPAGTTVDGMIVVHYSVFSEDPNNPNFDPDTSTVVPDATIDIPASITVTPEPAAIGLAAAGLLCVAMLRRKS